MKNVLIIGSTGQIGSELPRTFRDESDTPMIVRMNVETG